MSIVLGMEKHQVKQFNDLLGNRVPSNLVYWSH